ncbi:MAG: HAD family phosphatase [Bacteroidia bacterium]|nr:HAD family phosphatase [Bacteroidia bacterium]MCZ2277625.1 HAD family phosphatase [Bacteroidia bacterium]
MAVRNIILDFGGVIIDVDYLQAAESFRKLGISDFEVLYSRKSQASFFDDFETGKLSNRQFREHVRTLLTGKVTDRQIDAAWNSMVFSIPRKRLDYLLDLKEQYKLFLLSNTNRIHIKDFTEKLERKFGKHLLNRIFEKLYFSCSIGIRKPDPLIFQMVISENRLKPGETIFVDDSIQHIRGAREAGIKSYHLDVTKYKLEDWLPDILQKNSLNS